MVVSLTEEAALYVVSFTLFVVFNVVSLTAEVA